MESTCQVKNKSYTLPPEAHAQAHANIRSFQAFPISHPTALPPRPSFMERTGQAVSSAWSAARHVAHYPIESATSSAKNAIKAPLEELIKDPEFIQTLKKAVKSAHQEIATTELLLNNLYEALNGHSRNTLLIAVGDARTTLQKFLPLPY